MTILLQSLVLGILLIGRADYRSDTNLALAGGSFAFALSMVESLLSHLHFGAGLPIYFWTALKLPILWIPPFIYLHMQGLIAETHWTFRPAHIRHGAFALAAILLFTVGLGLHLPARYDWPDPVISRAFRQSPAFWPAAIALVIWYGVPIVTALQGGWYIASILRATRGRIGIRILWLRFLLQGTAGFLFLFAVVEGLGRLVVDAGWMVLTAHICALMLLYTITWASFHHGPAFERSPGQLLQDLVAHTGKYRKSPQSADRAERVLGKLEKAFAAEALHRDPDLTLPIVAAHIGTSPNIVSQALNQRLGQNFFDYINDLRIADAKRMLAAAEQSEKTILDIAFACGFNSKSTFNSAFKKRTLTTPSLFRKSALMQGRAAAPPP